MTLTVFILGVCFFSFLVLAGEDVELKLACTNYLCVAEKDFGRDEHRIIISHTSPFNEKC